MDDQVGKLIEPAPVAFTFSAPGWYVVGVLVLLLIILCIYLLIKHYKNNLYRRHALVYLADTANKFSSVKAFGQMVYETNMLIKRIAMGRYGRQNVSGLREKEWISFINTTWREKSFDDNDATLLGQSIYMPLQPITNEQATAFINKAKRWIKNHKRHL